MNKAFKFRIYPNAFQQTQITRTFGCVRFVYNRMLADRIRHYEETGESLSNTPAQYKKEFEWLREVDSLALANAQLNLNKAYQHFFREQAAGFPQFKSKKSHRKSYTTNWVNNNIRLEKGSIILPKLKAVKIKQHREIPADYRLKSVTVSQTPSGAYYASILYECQKGSKNRSKQRIKVAQIHEKVTNQRKDFLHKQSRQITNAVDAVCIEDLNMKGMSQALNFGKSVSDTAFGTFVRMLDYKLKEQGKQLIKIDKWYPSSKLCSSCGEAKKTLDLSERTYHCEACGAVINRDYNASINIRREGMRLLLA